MKICINCGKPGFICTDAYAPERTFCKHCGSLDFTIVEAVEAFPQLKFVKRYCLDCGTVIEDGKKSCPNCYGTPNK